MLSSSGPDEKKTDCNKLNNMTSIKPTEIKFGLIFGKQDM